MRNGTIDDNSAEQEREMDATTSPKPLDSECATSSESVQDGTQWWESQWFQSWEGAARKS